MRFEGEQYSVHKKDGQILVRTWPSRKTAMNPLWWVAWGGLFCWRWFLSRPYIPMLLAVPAIVVTAGLIAAATSGAGISKGTEAIKYRRLFDRSLASGDLAQARLAADALVRFNPSSEEHLYNRAYIEEKGGQKVLATQLMLEAATQGNSLRAAMWLANSIGNVDDYATWTEEQRSQYFHWLTVASENDPSDPLPKRLIGDILRYVGDYKGAYAAMLPIADIDVESTYIVTFLEKKLGLLEKARARAERLGRVYRGRIADNPRDIEARTQYASMLILLERESEAIDVLNGGLVVAEDPVQIQGLKSAICEAMVIEATKIQRIDPSPLGLMRGLERLRQAMGVDANNPHLLEAVTQACLRASESKNDELTILREAIVQGIAPDTAHFILGTIALNDGQLDEAQQHLEIAVKNNPNLPGLLNNLAHAISNDEDPDLERALRLSDAAVASLPNHTYLRETRGQIYFQLERFTEAIADLEYALASPELRPQIRESLAVAYDKLGQPEIAQRQRELLKAGK